MEDGFSRYTIQRIVEKGQIVGSVSVAGGETASVDLVAAEYFAFPLTSEEKTSILLSGQEFVYAPVVQGQEAGYAYIMLDEKPVGKVALRYAQTVEQEKQPEKKPFWKRWFGGGT